MAVKISTDDSAGGGGKSVAPPDYNKTPSVFSKILAAVVNPVSIISQPAQQQTLKVTTGIADLVKSVTVASAYVVAAPINSVTGHKFEAGELLSGDVGKVVGGAMIMGQNGLNIAGKSFADALSGGYASKAVDLIRTDENKERGTYTESILQANISPAAQRITDSIGKIGGAIYASTVGQGESKGTGEASTATKTVEDVGLNTNVASNLEGAGAANKAADSSFKSLLDSTGGGFAGGLNVTQTQTPEKVSVLGSVFSGLNTFLGSDAGKAVTQVAVAALTPAKAQAAAFSTPTAANIAESVSSAAQAAAFGNSGQSKFATVTTGSTTTVGSFFDKYGTWIMIGAGVIGTLLTIFALFKKRR